MSQRNVPGIDCAYLAMDTEEGVEVVWNEVQFSERKSYKAQEVSCLLSALSKFVYYNTKANALHVFAWLVAQLVVFATLIFLYWMEVFTNYENHNFN